MADSQGSRIDRLRQSVINSINGEYTTDVCGYARAVFDYLRETNKMYSFVQVGERNYALNGSQEKIKEILKELLFQWLAEGYSQIYFDSPSKEFYCKIDFDVLMMDSSRKHKVDDRALRPLHLHLRNCWRELLGRHLDKDKKVECIPQSAFMFSEFPYELQRPIFDNFWDNQIAPNLDQKPIATQIKSKFSRQLALGLQMILPHQILINLVAAQHFLKFIQEGVSKKEVSFQALFDKRPKPMSIWDIRPSLSGTLSPPKFTLP